MFGCLLLVGMIERISAYSRRLSCAELVFRIGGRRSEIGNEHIGAVGAERPRDGSPYAVVAAGDESRLPFQFCRIHARASGRCHPRGFRPSRITPLQERIPISLDDLKSYRSTRACRLKRDLPYHVFAHGWELGSANLGDCLGSVNQLRGCSSMLPARQETDVLVTRDNGGRSAAMRHLPAWKSQQA